MSNPTKRYWRSLDDFAGGARSERARQREFVAQAADEIELDGVSRRQFVGIMGASAALAGGGLQGCVRKPAQYILPYANRPEDLLPGEARYFATVLQVGGHVQGVLVESQDGRPTKIEGNLDHPASLGRTTALVQAEVLGLYDVDRSRGAMVNGTPSAVTDGLSALADFELNEGSAILVTGRPSPTLNTRLDSARNQGARVYVDGPDHGANSAAGLGLVADIPVTPYCVTEAAKVLVAVDSDFLGSGPNSVANAAGFAAGRTSQDPANMNRLYAIEPAFTTTGASADNRYQLPASQIGAFMQALAAYVLRNGGTVRGGDALVSRLGAGSEAARFDEWVSGLGDDLLANRGASALVVGERLHDAQQRIAAALLGITALQPFHLSAETLRSDQKGN